MAVIKDLVGRQFANRDVGIEEFCTSDEFCGKTVYPRQIALLKLIFLEEMTGYEEDVVTEWATEGGEVWISPNIRERRDWLRANKYSHFPEIGMIGGRRSSKGFVTSLAVVKKMYDTFKLGDPGAHYGIDPDKEIYFTAVAASMEQAKTNQFADLVSSASRCRALSLGKIQEESFTIPTPADQQYILSLRNKNTRVGRDFSKLRCKPMAANADTIRGSATLALIFDEMAWMMAGESRSSAAQCYAAAKPSLDQFGKDSMIFLNSSPWTKIGMFYDRYQDSMRLDSKGMPLYPSLFFIRFPSWELYRNYGRNPKIKRAIMVSPDSDLTKLNEEDRVIAVTLQFNEQADPETFKVERRALWAEVIDAFLDAEKVDAAFCSSYRGRPIKMQLGGTYAYSYKGHADPSTTTAGFGFAIAHIEEFQNDSGIMEPHVVFDVVQRWNPAAFATHTIDQLEVLDEIALWIDLFRPFEFTFDQFNSAAPIQWLRERLAERHIGGTRIGEVTASYAKNWDRWQVTKSAFNLGLIHIPDDCPDAYYAAMELKFLQDKGGRIEKQNLGEIRTKDIADCIAECTYTLMNHIIGTGPQALGGLNSAYGSPGGYRIGGMDREGLGKASSDITDFYRSARTSGGQSKPNRSRGRY